MVSFNCNYCQDVVKKPKIRNHYNQCGSDSYTCVDCMQVFDLNSIQAHTSCISEVQKYQGKWQQKGQPGQRSQHARKPPAPDSDDEEYRNGIAAKSARPEEAVTAASANHAANDGSGLNGGKSCPTSGNTATPASHAGAAASVGGVNDVEEVITVSTMHLGTKGEMRRLVRGLLEEAGTPLKAKGVAKAVVDAMAKSLGKQLAQHIVSAVDEHDGIVFDEASSVLRLKK